MNQSLSFLWEEAAKGRLGLKKLGQLDAGTPRKRLPIERTFRFKAEHDPLFRAACKAAKIPPTKRQYSKYQRDRGLSSAYIVEAHRILADAAA